MLQYITVYLCVETGDFLLIVREGGEVCFILLCQPLLQLSH